MVNIWHDPFAPRYNKVSPNRYTYTYEWRSLMGTWTPEKAWFIGVVWGDGCIHRSGKSKNGNPTDSVVNVVLDPETLQKVANLVCPQIKLHPNSVSTEVLNTNFRSMDFVNWFVDMYGLVGEKCDRICLPWDLPEELYSHFLRGLWDTDGSVMIYDTYNKIENLTGVSSYGGTSRQMVEEVRSLILKLTEAPEVVLSEIKKPPHKDYFKVSWSGASAVPCAEYVYGNAPEHIRNDRKYNNYLMLKSIIEERKDRLCPDCGEHANFGVYCRKHFWEHYPHTTGPGTECVNGDGREVYGHGLCRLCWGREYAKTYDRKAVDRGICACGKNIHQRGMCTTCYARERRVMLKAKKDGISYSGVLAESTKHDGSKNRTESLSKDPDLL